ncbi:AT hook motif [Actinomyces oris]|uniref:AT hook motif n=1 Tax=Actinomyces oris TaxID=544580 RepID=A0A1Q8VDA9_9ACTO|nr:hypothetical protein [Actinomyces oris]OLO46082.1 AT hook motif [Actinomyces oris]
MRTTRATLALATILILAGCSQGSPSSAGSAAATGSAPAAAATSSGGGGATPSIPAGHQVITAPTSGLTFAIPEDWQDLNALPEAQKALLARAQGQDPSALTQHLSSTDAFYGRFSQSAGISFNSVAVAKEAEASSTPPSQESLDETITRQGGTPTGYSTKQSTHGQAAVDTSTAQVQGVQTAGAVVAVPTSSGTYVRIAVTAGSAEEVDTIVSTILTTAR